MNRANLLDATSCSHLGMGNSDMDQLIELKNSSYLLDKTVVD
jgi:hypothetical protein